jgi:hypothetical protein
LASGQEVQVEVGHRFSSMGAVIDNHPKAVLGVSFLPGNLADLQHEVPEQVAVL